MYLTYRVRTVLGSEDTLVLTSSVELFKGCFRVRVHYPCPDLFLTNKMPYYALLPCTALCIFVGSLFILYNA